METYSRKDNDGYYPQLLDLIPKESREWMVKRGDETSGRGHGANPDEKKLELRLGPPGGGDDWTIINDSNSSKNHSKGDNSNSNLFSFGYFSNTTSHKFSSSPWRSSSPSSVYQQQQKGSFYQLQTAPTTQKNLAVVGVKPKESSQPCCSTKVAYLQQQAAEKKAFSPAATAVGNSAQKRTGASVVGWPPIRSFRKNLASSSSTSLKSASESPNVVPNKVEKPIENSQKKGLFVKINMDCIPIGRKVDLNAYDSYEKLSSAVDQLFRGLLAAQNDSSAGGAQKKDEGERAITGLLDGSGEYTLVYEDNEGDRMLVGDVPWHMFVSTVKRLRVLKSSELPMLSCGSKHGKKPLHS